MNKSKQITTYLMLIMVSGVLILLAYFWIHGTTLSNGKNVSEKKSVSSNKQNESIVLNYYVWDEEQFYASKIVNSYNSYQDDVHVNLCVIDNDEYDESIDDAILSGEKVDVLDVRGISSLLSYQSKGILAEITERIMNSGRSITAYGNIFSNIAIEGRYYGFPYRSTCWMLVYNKNIFDEMNLEYPGQLTWEEYRQIAMELTHRDENGETIWGGLFVTWDPNLLGVQQSNYLHDDDLTSVKQSIEFIHQVINVDHSHILLSKQEENEYMGVFESGRIAMMPMGEWFIGMIMEDEKKGVSTVDWDIAPFPIAEDMAQGTTCGQYQFTSISSTCKNKDAAFDFIEYLTGKEGAIIFTQNGMLSAYCDDEIKELYKQVVGNKNTDVLFNAYRVQEVPMVEGYDKLQLYLRDAVKQYLSGDISLDETIDEFDQKRKRLFQN